MRSISMGRAGRVTPLSAAPGTTYVVGAASITIIENPGEGADTVQVWDVSYTLLSNVENLTLMQGSLTGTGSDLANRMEGSSGNDIVDGQEATIGVWRRRKRHLRLWHGKRTRYDR